MKTKLDRNSEFKTGEEIEEENKEKRDNENSEEVILEITDQTKKERKLNKEQLEAINFVSGNLLIMASAGTGKTTTIVERYANMIENHGYEPSEILMTTFTNKAAKDMAKKIVERTGKEPPYIGTMHSLFLRILRTHTRELNLDKNFTLIYDDSDKKKIVKQVLAAEKMDTKSDAVKYFLRWIGKFKNRGILAENLSETRSVDENAKSGLIEETLDDEIIKIDPAMRKYVNKIYIKYEEELHARNSIDLDDILLLTYRLFENNLEVRREYSQSFKAIMVDEAQDLNSVQINILNLLKNKNLCLIGDDCQNIYEWRGSSNQLVFDFSENEKKFYLKDNYRSDKNIIDCVNKVIQSMRVKIDKKLNGTRASKGKVSISSFSSADEEREFIAYEIKQLLKNNVKAEDIAVLFRTNRIGKMLDRELKRNKIHCHLSKSRDLFEREETKDILSFLRFKVNPRSIIDFQRVLGLIPGMGKTSAKKLIELSLNKGCSLVEILSFTKELKMSEEKSAQMYKLKIILEKFNSNPIVLLLDDLGYRNSIIDKYREEEERLEDKLENIKLMQELYSEYDSTKEDIQKFLDEIIELEKKDKTKEKVVLSTIHSSKGLEWPYVFIISCNEGTLPWYKGELDNMKRDSELRLFYVAISRAKKSLVLTHYDKNEFGRYNPRSSFIDILR